MSGQTCAWRSLYSPQPVLLDLELEAHAHVWSSFRFSIRCGSEVEVADVVGVEDVRVAEQHDAVRADRVLAELAGLERVALFAGDVTLDQRLGRVRGEVAEVAPGSTARTP